MCKKQATETVANPVKHVYVLNVRREEHGEVNCWQDKYFIIHFSFPFLIMFKWVSVTQNNNWDNFLEKPKNYLGNKVFGIDNDERND